MKFSIKDFFSKCDEIRRNLRIWFHLLKKPLMENFVFCAVFTFQNTNISINLLPRNILQEVRENMINACKFYQEKQILDICNKARAQTSEIRV